MRLIIATHNEGKAREIEKILSDFALTVISLKNLGFKSEIKENGRTFFVNARKKALAVSRIYKHDYVVGEDSGLIVGYLKGKPGVRSRRYAGAGAGDEKNNLKLLKKLAGVKTGKRRAAYYCCAVLARKGMVLEKFEGKLTGRIAGQAAGGGGFGYDPIFYLPEYKKTVAELPLAEKNKISHRAKAFGKIKRYFYFLLRKKEKLMA